MGGARRGQGKAQRQGQIGLDVYGMTSTAGLVSSGWVMTAGLGTVDDAARFPTTRVLREWLYQQFSSHFHSQRKELINGF
jgi:hypothetical protein